MKDYLMKIKNVLIVLLSRILLFFNIKKDNSPIPEGMYCYEPDIEKNKNRKDFSKYYIKPCKYYKRISKNYNGCSYLGVITDDMVFDDQCKLCNENLGDDD